MMKEKEKRIDASSLADDHALTDNGRQPTLAIPDELLILAYEVLEEHMDSSKSWPLCFSSFQTDWMAIHIENHGPYVLS